MKLLFFIIFMGTIPNFCFPQDSIDYKVEKQLVEILLQDQAAIDSIVDKMLRHSYSLKSVEAEFHQKYESLSQEKRSWLSTFVIGVNLYSQSTVLDESTNSSVTTSGVLPNLGVSLNISPERIFNLQSNIRIARADVIRAENTLKEQRRALKLFILGKYYEYLEALNVLELRFNSFESQRQQVQQIKLKFERGEAALVDYLMVQNGFTSTEEALLRAKVFVLKLKKEISLYTSDSETEK